MATAHQFTEQRIDGATWEPRYKAALLSDNRNAYMKIAAEMEAVDEPLWAAFYDLATSDDAEFRAELHKEIVHDFAAYRAAEDFAHASYMNDWSEWSVDRSDWIERRTAQYVGGMEA